MNAKEFFSANNMSMFVFTGAESYFQFHCNINFKFSICSLRQTCVAGIF